MDRPPLKSALYCMVVLLAAAPASPVLKAQSKPATDAQTRATAELVGAIDRLVEQNRLLEDQNQQLIEQINALRKILVPGAATGVVPAAGSASQSETAPQNSEASGTTGAANSNPNNATYDPAGSNGSPALFGEWNPGEGFTVAKTPYGQLDLSGYMVTRYLNQLPAEQSATDHLGRPIPVKPRQDFQFHRVLLYAKGWLFDEKFNYLTVIWTVNDTTQVAVGGALWYDFNKHFTLGAGYTALPGTQSMQGSHPYWPTYDRVMADEFFRPFYTQGLFGYGLLTPRLVYRFAVGNNLSLLGIPAVQLSRDLSTGGSLTWLPTTGEFGPRGAFGDYEEHEKLATRFNIAYTRSREPRFSPLDDAAANTTLRLADSLNVFDPDALAPGVTVTKVTYQMASAAAGIKYHGLWLQGEGYGRRLDNFEATGPLPVGVVRDYGFYAQGSYMVVPKKVEVYAGTSYIFSNYGKPKEFIAGGNYYPWRTRNIRLNLHLINLSHSAVSSTFGFYTGQVTGTILAVGMTALY